MSILTQNQNTQLSTEQKKERVKNRILSSAHQTYNSLLMTQKQGIDIVWNNSQGLTPQEVCDSLGNNAVKIFEYHGSLTNFIVSLAVSEGIQPDISLPKNAFIKNEDGTVTITDQPYVP